MGDTPLKAIPIDISRSGILVRWPGHCVPSINPQHDVLVRLRYRDIETSIRGRIRRFDGATVGISFTVPPDSSGNAELDAILDKLEAEWVDKRLWGRRGRRSSS